MNVVKQVERIATKVLKPLDNKVMGTTVRVALILYASLIAPELPEVIARQLDNIAVRSVLIFLIAYLAIKDPITAALATLALMVTVMSLHRRDVQGVLGKAVDLAGGATAKVADMAENALDLVGLGLVDEPVEEAPVQTTTPAGVESGMDNAGSL